MSDNFFDQYNRLNSADEAGQDPSSANNGYSAPADTGASIPAASAPEQSAGWQRSYYSAPTSEPIDSSYNPYVRKAPQTTYTGASVSDDTHTASPRQNANTYFDADGFYHRSFTEHRNAPAHSERKPAVRREKKEKASLSKGAVALLIIACILLSGAAGFGGSMIASKLNENKNDTAAAADTVTDSGEYSSINDQVVIHKVDVVNSTESGAELVDKATDEITRDVADSVVEITTEVVQTNSYYGQYIAQGAGSGVIISTDGYIVTNNHVIEDASNITVTLRSGESYEAQFIGTDADEDIALLKIDAADLTTAIFGDSDTLEVGDKAIIIGNPLGTLGGSVTEGIVSALDRSIVVDGKTMHLMQTDAAINPGNSGGGMFNGQGELVGIVVAKSGGTTSSGSTIDNIGFVIPINNVLNILGDLKQYGYVRGKASTGMDFVDISNEMYAWYYFGSTSTGVFISSVDRNSNAADAGFNVGDRIISVDGKKVKSAAEISEIISSHSAGDTVTFELERNSRTGSIDLTLEEYVPNKSSAFSSY